jgi:hypothetical protein
VKKERFLKNRYKKCETGSSIIISYFLSLNYSSLPQSGIVSAGRAPPYGGIARPKGRHLWRVQPP